MRLPKRFCLHAALPVGLLAQLVAIAGCQRAPQSSGPGPLKVGAVIALTGSASLIGQDQRLGLELAQQAFKGGDPAVSLLLEDSGSDEQIATTAMRRLLSERVVAVIGPSLSQQAFAIDPIADRAGVPVLGPSNTAVGIPEIGPFVARVSAPVTQVAPLSIRAARRLNPKLRRVAVFFAQDDAYSTSETKIFQQAIRAEGLQLVTVQRTSTADVDFHKPVADTLQTRPDLIVISALPNDGGNLVRQIREIGFKGLIVAGNGLNSPNIYSVCQRYCDGLLIAQAYSPETTTPINRRLLALYRKRQGNAVPPQFAAQAFTAYQVLHEALQTLQRRQPKGQPLGALSLQELRRRLNATMLGGTYQTPLGELRFSPEGEVIQKNFYVAQVTMAADGRNGRFQLLP